jgi:hypothetical protein
MSRRIRLGMLSLRIAGVDTRHVAGWGRLFREA